MVLMYRPRPLTDKLFCDICGRHAKWYDREFHARYVLGEALCDNCEKRLMDFTNILKDDTPIKGLKQT